MIECRAFPFLKTLGLRMSRLGCDCGRLFAVETAGSSPRLVAAALPLAAAIFMQFSAMQPVQHLHRKKFKEYKLCKSTVDVLLS